MPNVKISDLTAATTAADADLVEIVQGGVNKKSALSVIKAWVQGFMGALDTDGALAANSDTRVASQKAVKTYADTKASSANAALTGTTTVGQLNPTTDSATSLGTSAKRFLGGWFIAPVSFPAYNVSGLPSAATWIRGVAIVVDATSPVKGSNVVGGGSVQTLVVSDGTNWKVS